MFRTFVGKLLGLGRKNVDGDGGVLIFQDNHRGRKFQFSLWDDGRVNVSRVEEVMGISPVVWQDKNGIYLNLEAREDGLSRQAFQSGEVIDLSWEHLAPSQAPSRYVSQSILDLDRTEVGPELVSETADVFNICGPLVWLWSELKDGDTPVTRTKDAEVMLLKREPGEELENDWDDRYDPAQHWEHMQIVKGWLSLPPSSSFGWATEQQRQGLRRDFMSDFCIANKCDELLVETSLGVKGSVLGMDMVKRLTWKGWCRSQLNYFLVAYTSQLPYVQLYTDMSTGGMAYVCRGQRAEQSLIWKIVFEKMEEVQEFVEYFGKRLPKSVKDFTKEELVEFEYLEDPPRAVFPYPGCRCLVQPPRIYYAPY